VCLGIFGLARRQALENPTPGKVTTRNLARPLKRIVQEQLLNPLATKLLEGEFKPGDRIKVTADGDGLVFKAK
jgi:ATP-dependent Clp protease ATP-binding subunit ClpA